MHQLMLTPWPIARQERRLSEWQSIFTESVSRSERSFCAQIGRFAVRSLYAELALYPKPGLVSLVDSGSHDDMNATTFVRSLFSLRHYFIRITQAGINQEPFSILKHLGQVAEVRMLAATGGINTHRGAIFALGMLCAAIGDCRSRRITLSVQTIRIALLIRWGKALAEHTLSPATDSSLSHGLRVAAAHAVSGAREELALGLPSVFEVALPTLHQTLRAGRNMLCAQIDAFFALMVHISDTNVYHRAGATGAATVRDLAQQFLELGGTAHPNWQKHALDCHETFVRQRLSPGGAADLLAATCLVYTVIPSNRKNTYFS